MTVQPEQLERLARRIQQGRTMTTGLCVGCGRRTPPAPTGRTRWLCVDCRTKTSTTKNS